MHDCCTGFTLRIQQLSKILCALFSSVLTLCQMERLLALPCSAAEHCLFLYIICRVRSHCLPMAWQTKATAHSCKATTPNDVLHAGLHPRFEAVATAAGQHQPGSEPAQCAERFVSCLVGRRGSPGSATASQGSPPRPAPASAQSHHQPPLSVTYQGQVGQRKSWQ